MRLVGRRSERPLSRSASARLLAEGARFNEEFQRLPLGRTGPVPKGIHRFRSHAEANRHDEACLAARMARLATRRK